jgi:hypothetical protein
LEDRRPSRLNPIQKDELMHITERAERRLARKPLLQHSSQSRGVALGGFGCWRLDAQIKFRVAPRSTDDKWLPWGPLFRLERGHCRRHTVCSGSGETVYHTQKFFVGCGALLSRQASHEKQMWLDVGGYDPHQRFDRFGARRLLPRLN